MPSLRLLECLLVLVPLIGSLAPEGRSPLAAKFVPYRSILMDPVTPVGSAKPNPAAAVFIHGIFGDASTWDNLITFLRQDQLVGRTFRLIPFVYPSPYARWHPMRRIP